MMFHVPPCAHSLLWCAQWQITGSLSTWVLSGITLLFSSLGLVPSGMVLTSHQCPVSPQKSAAGGS